MKRLLAVDTINELVWTVWHFELENNDIFNQVKDHLVDRINRLPLQVVYKDGKPSHFEYKRGFKKLALREEFKTFNSGGPLHSAVIYSVAKHAKSMLFDKTKMEIVFKNIEYEKKFELKGRSLRFDLYAQLKKPIIINNSKVFNIGIEICIDNSVNRYPKKVQLIRDLDLTCVEIKLSRKQALKYKKLLENNPVEAMTQLKVMVENNLFKTSLINIPLPLGQFI